jgi:hypothetical protein
LTGIECYGRPSAKALDQLHRKATALGDAATLSLSGVPQDSRTSHPTERDAACSHRARLRVLEFLI